MVGRRDGAGVGREPGSPLPGLRCGRGGAARQAERKIRCAWRSAVRIDVFRSSRPVQ
ncbi:hypothetical protein OPKNFCMD_3885 [Methylobacterium crusticola]|uniref:Uncharacterized protein n=1 Tax=Methylobacterium crusticola TaxID=1697972 RepID=A0ABQ4R0K1_9HYPH|nr:hypothetical protein OPKNFCMD_3885 [Methylobacterium crusticola]